MGARQKLNAAYFNGCLLISCIIGLLTQSWLVFGVVLALCAAASYHAGDIRPSRRDR